MATQQENISNQSREISNKAKGTLQEVQSMGEERLEQFKDIAGDFGKKISKTGKQVTDWSKDHPVQAALVGVSVGFLMGSLVRRATHTAGKKSS